MNEERWTVRRLLRWMSEDFAKLQVSSPRLDAELLIASVLSLSRVQLYLDLDRPLSREELGSARALVKRRRTYEPIAYILGQREFYGRSFSVGRAVLVPRPDTETLVDHALAALPGTGAGRCALDLCTGSGCIGITLAAERSELRVDITDCSPEALAVAEGNALALGVGERVRPRLGDLWSAVPSATTYDLITANPPYVTEAEYAALSPEVRDHEPRLALVAAEQGLAYYRALLAEGGRYLSPGGRLLFEVGAGQADAVTALCRDAGLPQVEVHRDLAGIKRVVVASGES